MSSLRAVPAIAALLVASCSSGGAGDADGVAQPIEEGRAAEPNELNATASFVSGDRICTAAVIAPDIAVTAAHCLVERVGMLCIERGVTADCTVVDAIIPRAYPEETCPKPSDLALLHLRRPLPDLPYFVPGGAVSSGQTCTVVGYGEHHKPDGEVEIVVRRLAKVRVNEVTPEAFRATGVDGNTAEGDSGGPVICGGKLVALTSCGTPGGNDGFYARLAPHLDWMNQKIAELQELSRCRPGEKSRCDRYADRDDLMKCDSNGKWALEKFCVQGSCSQPDGAGAPGECETFR